VAGQLEQNEVAAPGARHVHEERLVGLVVHLDIAARLLTQTVALRATGTPRGVERHIEKRAAVRRPCHAARRVRNTLGEVRAGRQILDSKLELLRPGEIDRIRQVAMIGTDLPRAKPAVRRSRRDLIQVQQDLFGRLGLVPPTAEDAVLPPRFRPPVVEPSVDPLGHREVGLLYPIHQFAVNGLLQRLRVPHGGSGPGVLCLEVRHDLGIVPISKPMELVQADVVVPFVEMRHRTRDWRFVVGKRSYARTRRQRGGCGRRKAERRIGAHQSVEVVTRGITRAGRSKSSHR
jgi:hypothetical protein